MRIHTRLTLCKIPFKCRYSSPARICSVKYFVTFCSKRPYLRKQLPTEPPGTYSRKLTENQGRTLGKETGSHAQEIWRFLKPKILNDVRMIEILEGLALKLQSFYNCDLSRVVFVTRRSRNLDLLYSDHFTSRSIQRQIDASKIALPDELTPNPLENGYDDVRWGIYE